MTLVLDCLCAKLSCRNIKISEELREFKQMFISMCE